MYSFCVIVYWNWKEVKTFAICCSQKNYVILTTFSITSRKLSPVDYQFANYMLSASGSNNDHRVLIAFLFVGTSPLEGHHEGTSPYFVFFFPFSHLNSEWGSSMKKVFSCVNDPKRGLIIMWHCTRSLSTLKTEIQLRSVFLPVLWHDAENWMGCHSVHRTRMCYA